MTDGIKITGGDLQSTVTLSDSAVTFNGTGFQKVTFDGETFDSMDDFWDHVRTLRAENASLRAKPKVKPLPRPIGASTWALDPTFVMEVAHKITMDEGWDASMEVVELAMLEAERRILEPLEWSARDGAQKERVNDRR